MIDKQALFKKHSGRIAEVVAKVRTEGGMHHAEGEGDEVYAYSRGGDQIAWGVNDGRTGANVLRGVRLADDSDLGVM